MASLNMDGIKATPGYKVILQAVLRAQIQQLVDQLAKEANEESVILTANVTDGTLSHLGSDYGKMFLSTYADVKQQFLGFCLHGHHSSSNVSELQASPAISSDGQNCETKKAKLSKNLKKRKKYSIFVPKPRYTPYHKTNNPKPDSPSNLNEETAIPVLENMKDCKPLSPVQNNIDAEKSNDSSCKKIQNEMSNNYLDQSVSTGSDDKIKQKQIAADGINLAEIPSDAEKVKSECNVVKDNNMVIDKDGQVSNESLKSVDENIQEVSGVSLYQEDNETDTDTTVEWAENPDSSDETVEQDGFPGKGQQEVDDNANHSRDNLSPTQTNTNQDKKSLQSKHVIVTKHTTYDSVDEEDDSNVSEQARKPPVLRKNINESSAGDSNDDEEDDQCSKEDSIKDYLSDEESKFDLIGVKVENDSEEKLKQDSCEQVTEDIKEPEAKSVEVMEACHQTMDQMMQCVTRAISEERKDKIASLEMQSEGLGEIPQETHSESSESDSNIKGLPTDEPDSGNTNKEDTNDSVQTNEAVEDNVLDTGDDDSRDKSYKVLAIWNEIANDTSEASSEVLYDLIADKLKQNQKKKSVERDSQTDVNNGNASNTCAMESECVQTEITMERSEQVISKGIRETFESESSRKSECLKESTQKEQKMVDKEKEHNNVNEIPLNIRQGSCESDLNKNSGKQTSESVDRNTSDGTDIAPGDKLEGSTVAELKNMTSRSITSENASTKQQDSCYQQVMTTGNQTRKDCGSETSVRNENEVLNKSEIQTKNTDKNSKSPVVIDIDKTAPQPAKLNTPLKNNGGKQTSANTPKQVKTPVPNVNKQKFQKVIPGKQGKSLVDNLISTGVPIIIPDDDDDDDDFNDDDEDDMLEADEFMPSPRSTAFELKSKQYREQQEMRAAQRMSQITQRQGYSSYSPQTSAQMSQNKLSSYSQYPAQLQQHQHYQYQEYQDRQFGNQQHQYHYPEYHEQMQFGNQQIPAQQMYSPQKSPSHLRQQLFTPPKNVSGVSSTRGRPMKSLPSPVREMSPQSHNFSPPRTPTTPKGSPYFKQGYMTPTKQQQNVPSLQSRTTPNKSPAQKTTSQQDRYSSIAKPNISSGRAIVIEDEPSTVTRKLHPSKVFTHHQQSMPKQTYVLKSPVSPRHQHSVQQPIVQQVPADPLRIHKQTVSKEQQHLIGLDTRPFESRSGTLPVISNVASMSVPIRDSTTGIHMQQTQYRQIAPNPSPGSTYVNYASVRQTNERTPVKRTRSDDTAMSPSMVVAEPANKRRHTSADNASLASQQSDIPSLPISPEPLQGQSNIEGQISPSKMPPKLEIDIDDVRGALPELSDQLTSLKSPPILSRVNELPNDEDEKPIIPMSPQLARSDLKSFSPPVSPSTRRLHATPGKRSKASAGGPTQGTGDETSAPSLENQTQTMKKFGCGDCGKSYTTKAALNQHFRKHTQERPFECDVCGKHYSQKGYLKKHIRTHFGEK